jgi:hypothetical protein
VSAMRGVNLVSVTPETSPQKSCRPESRGWRDGHEEDYDPDPPEPLAHAAPEEDGGRLGLHIREQRRAGGREATHRLESRVEQAAKGSH